MFKSFPIKIKTVHDEELEITVDPLSTILDIKKQI
jgi:hypothetical protein